MNINIKRETPADYKIVEEITREAFWNLYVPGCEEHLLVHNLRQSKDFIKELSFIIELDNEIVGSIFYSHSTIVSPSGNEYKTISFGPVSIHPKYHRQGLGFKLITHSINEAKKLGFTSIVIGGYPYHYNIYGFTGAKKYNIYLPDGKFYTGILALELKPDALADISGAVHFSECLEAATQAQLDIFDKLFPAKEKLACDSQKQFELAISEIDNNTY